MPFNFHLVPICIAVIAFFSVQQIAQSPGDSKLPIQKAAEAKMSNIGKAHTSLNVMKKPLALFGSNTGFYRNGKCDVGPEDTGNHSVAATVTDEFLDFTASRGNNLRAAGLTAGCKWCLCAGRWREALEYAKQQGKESSALVPKVHMHATHEKALDVVSYDELKKYAADHEVGNTGGGAGTVLKPKETTEMSDRKSMTSRAEGETGAM